MKELQEEDFEAALRKATQDNEMQAKASSTAQTLKREPGVAAAVEKIRGLMRDDVKSGAAAARWKAEEEARIKSGLKPVAEMNARAEEGMKRQEEWNRKRYEAWMKMQEDKAREEEERAKEAELREQRRKEDEERKKKEEEERIEREKIEAEEREERERLEEIERIQREAREKIEREEREAREKIEREEREAREKIEREEREAREKVEAEERKAREKRREEEMEKAIGSEITVHIDRGMGLQISVILKRDMTAEDIKKVIAGDDPTGDTAPTDFGLLDCSSGMELDDCTPISFEHKELEIVTGSN